MRVLVLHAHPVETSFAAAAHVRVVAALAGAGHAVDDCDLYAENFQPVLTRAERLGYHDLSGNREPVADHVRRLLAAEALVLVFPVWNFGFPAILKGYFDRVFLPGVSFRLEGGVVKPALTSIRKVAAVATYGGSRWRALAMGDPPRRVVTRVLKGVTGGAPVAYHALYDMNRASERRRGAFLDRVVRSMERF